MAYDAEHAMEEKFRIESDAKIDAFLTDAQRKQLSGLKAQAKSGSTLMLVGKGLKQVRKPFSGRNTTYVPICFVQEFRTQFPTPFQLL